MRVAGFHRPGRVWSGKVVGVGDTKSRTNAGRGTVIFLLRSRNKQQQSHELYLLVWMFTSRFMDHAQGFLSRNTNNLGWSHVAGAARSQACAAVYLMLWIVSGYHPSYLTRIRISPLAQVKWLSSGAAAQKSPSWCALFVACSETAGI